MTGVIPVTLPMFSNFTFALLEISVIILVIIHVGMQVEVV